MENKTGTSKVGAISKAQKAQSFLNYKKGTFGLFGTIVCCKISKTLKMGPFEGKKNWKKSCTVSKKIERGDSSVSSAFANARKSFWLEQGPEPVTTGFTVNRVKCVLKNGTYTMRSVV